VGTEREERDSNYGGPPNAKINPQPLTMDSAGGVGL